MNFIKKPFKNLTNTSKTLAAFALIGAFFTHVIPILAFLIVAFLHLIKSLIELHRTPEYRPYYLKFKSAMIKFFEI